MVTMEQLIAEARSPIVLAEVDGNRVYCGTPDCHKFLGLGTHGALVMPFCYGCKSFARMPETIDKPIPVG